jgi:zinc/manganese transport system substrate-binding protein
MRLYINIIIIIFMIITLGKLEAGELKIVTTLPSLASITEYIGGDRVEVMSITKGSQDAHYVEAKPSYMVKLNKADLLIYSGLELEIGWLPLLIQGSRNNRVAVGSRGNLNASQILQEDYILEKPRGEVDRSMGDVHPCGNPHYLLNPEFGIKVAELITHKLSELDPDYKDIYQQNLIRFQNKLNENIDQYKIKIEKIKGSQVICYHVHWSYLLDWMGLISAGYIELRPGIPPTPKHKRGIIELIKNKNIKIIIISSWKEPTKAKEVASGAGANLVILPGEVAAIPEANDYFSWIDYLVNTIYNEFSKIEK